MAENPRSQLNNISEQKEVLRKELLSLRDNYLAILYKAGINSESFQNTAAELMKATINSKVPNSPYSKALLKQATNSAQKISSHPLSDVLLIPFSKMNLSQKLEADNKIFDLMGGVDDLNAVKTSTIVNATNDFEGKEKIKIIDSNIAKGREDKKIFYLCSAHANCAKDHLAYQGKLYVDEKYSKDYPQFKTFQWVIGKPVWMITRPNCRHFFKSLSEEEALGKPINDILSDNKMVLSVGDRTYMQTLRHPTNKSWYEKSNVETIIARYKERLETHKTILRTNENSPLLRAAVQKDNLLINKWESYLQKLIHS